MLFHEIYGNYYHTVAQILKEALNNNLDRKSLNNIVQREAFGESIMTIPDELLNGKWGLLTPDYETPLLKEPSMPLTLLEKRWLKALLLDPRIQLFEPDLSGLEDVTPLFKQEWIVYFDQYTDGDSFSDPQYIQNFRCILLALKKKKKLEITFTDQHGNLKHTFLSPGYLEYSEKNDRFRLIGDGYRPLIINLSRLNSCEMVEEASKSVEDRSDQITTVILELTDRRKALERFMLNFSTLKKETKKMDDIHYLVKLYYDKQDESEILIRILSFGIWVKVLEPADFREKIRIKIEKQINLIAQNK